MNRRIFKDETSSNGEIPFYKIGTFGKKANAFITKEKFEEYKQKYPYPNPGDTLISASGSIGRTVIYNGENAYYQDSNIVWLKHDGKVDNTFLNQFYNIVKWSGIEGTTIKRLYNKNILDTKITLPDLSEQKEIGHLLNTLDSMINLHQESITKTHQIFQIFQSKMSANLEENTPKIRNINYSNQWNQSRLGDIGNTFTSLSGKTKDDFGHGDAEYVPYLNVFNNPIADTSLTDKIMKDPKQNSLQYGDILFTVSSETPNEVGMSSVWLDNRPNVYLNSFCFGFRPVMKYDHLFLANLLRSDSFRKQMYILAQGVSRYNISKIKAMDIKLKLPIYEEQVYIGEFFKLLNLNLQLRKKKIKILQELKGEYLRKMFL